MKYSPVLRHNNNAGWKSWEEFKVILQKETFGNYQLYDTILPWLGIPLFFCTRQQPSLHYLQASWEAQLDGIFAINVYSSAECIISPYLSINFHNFVLALVILMHKYSASLTVHISLWDLVWNLWILYFRKNLLTKPENWNIYLV